MSIKNANKVSSIPRSILLYESIVDVDITNPGRHSQKVFFSIKVIDVWNSLPESVIHSNTVNTLKAKIDCLFKNRGYILVGLTYMVQRWTRYI